MIKTCLGFSLGCGVASALFVAWLFLTTHERTGLHGGYPPEVLLTLAIWFLVPSLGVFLGMVPLLANFQRRLAIVALAINLLSHPMVVLGAVVLVASLL